MVLISGNVMKYLWHIYVIGISCLFSCANNVADIQDGVIVFDSRKEYPVLDLKLSELAEVSFVKIKGEDSVNFLTHAYDLPENIYVDNNRIIIGDCLPNKDIEPKNDHIIYLFDETGDFIRSFGRSSRNPNEWQSSIRMLYDSHNEEVITHQISYFGNILERYDIHGNHLSTDTLDNPYRNSICIDRKIILQNIYTKYAVVGKISGTGGKSINVYDIDSKSYESVEPYPHEQTILELESSAPHALYASEKGIYVTDKRSDIVYLFDKDYKFLPKFKSVREPKYRNNPEIQNLLYPLIETEEYILFCNNMDFKSQTAHRFKYGNYIFMKGENKIYQLQDLGYIDYDFDKHIDIVMYEDYLLKDEIAFSNQMKTLNSDILVCAIEPSYLYENFDTLPLELKNLSENISSDDNPVLVIMKFGKPIMQ